MTNYKKANKKWWNKVAPIHLYSKYYDLAGFKKGKSSLFPIEKEELGSLNGKSLLHLMCHFGMDTLSLARLGADVTGVDISDKSINIAKKISKELKIPGNFICSDVYNLSKILDKKFDIVFMSYGVLCWLPDMKKFIKLVNRFLKDKGVFYIVDLHPFTNILSHDFKIEYSYFEKGPFEDNSEGTYTNWNADIKSSTYLWSYTMCELVNTLINEDLRLEYIHEFPHSIYEQFPGLMRKNKKGLYVFKNKKIQIPLLFSLKATK